MKKINTVKMIGFVGMLVGGLASMITSYVQSKQMEELIDEKVNKALAEKELENKEES